MLGSGIGCRITTLQNKVDHTHYEKVMSDLLQRDDFEMMSIRSSNFLYR